MKAKGRQAVLKTYLKQPSCESSSECWRTGTLSDIAEVNPKTQTDHLDENSPVTFLPMECLNEDGRILKKLVRPFAEVKTGYPYFQPGDVLFPKITPCMENGKGAIALELVNGVGFGSTEFFILRPKDGVSPEYVYQVTRSPSFRKIAVRYMSGSAGQQRVQRDIFFSHRIPLPPLPEQQRIATVLATVDEAIAATDALIAKIEMVRQAALVTAFDGRLTRIWRESNPEISAEDLIEKIRNYHITQGGTFGGKAAAPTEGVHDLSKEDLPNNWRIVPLQWLCRANRPICYGILKPGPDVFEGIPYIRVVNYPKNYLELDGLKKTTKAIASHYKRSTLISGDLLLSIRGTVGRVCVVPKELEGANITQDTARISINDLVLRDYVRYILESPTTQNRMCGATKGMAVQGINIGDVRVLQIPLPPLPEQRRIAAILSSVDDRLATERTERDRLITLKKGLMQVLLTGRVRVPPGVAEEGTPAHV